MGEKLIHNGREDQKIDAAVGHIVFIRIPL
jgi:hypothetical protein